MRNWTLAMKTAFDLEVVEEGFREFSPVEATQMHTETGALDSWVSYAAIRPIDAQRTCRSRLVLLRRQLAA